MGWNNRPVSLHEVIHGKKKEIEELFPGAHLALPLLRKTPAALVTPTFTSVTPMAAPSGVLFYLDYKYEEKGIIKRAKKYLEKILKRIKKFFYELDSKTRKYCSQKSRERI
jgi:hypothetical protein